MKTIPSPFALPFAFPGLRDVRCAFGTRIGGQSTHPYDRGNISLEVGDDQSRVLSNRRSLKHEFGFENWQEVKQVHGTDMVFDPAPTAISDEPLIEADGLATATAGQALVIKTADCQPILLAHNSGKYVAALHVGWRGNVSDFPKFGVQMFCDHYSLNPKEILAVRGPSLGPGASEFMAFDSEFGSAFSDYFNPEKQTVDLWTLTRDQLLEAGIIKEHLFRIDLCTFSLPDMFFSYRRSQTTGRQASMIWING